MADGAGRQRSRSWPTRPAWAWAPPPWATQARRRAASASLRLQRPAGRRAAAGAWAAWWRRARARAWRMAAEFVLEPGAGTQIQAGSGYGTRLLRPLGRGDSDAPARQPRGGRHLRRRTAGRPDGRALGVHARARVTPTSASWRDRNHLDPIARLRVEADRRTRPCAATVATRTHRARRRPADALHAGARRRRWPSRSWTTRLRRERARHVRAGRGADPGRSDGQRAHASTRTCSDQLRERVQRTGERRARCASSTAATWPRAAWALTVAPALRRRVRPAPSATPTATAGAQASRAVRRARPGALATFASKTRTSTTSSRAWRRCIDGQRHAPHRLLPAEQPAPEGEGQKTDAAGQHALRRAAQPGAAVPGRR